MRMNPHSCVRAMMRRKKMKKLMAMLVLAATICMAVAGCGKKADDKTQETVKAAETAPDGSAVTEAAAEVETNAENGLPANRQPDATAPVVDTVMVYAMVNGKMSQVMDSVEELNEQTLLDKLIELGTVAEGTTLVSFEKVDTGETVLAGPGAPEGQDTMAVQDGALTLSGFKPGEGLDEATAEKAVADTYAANFELNQCTVTLQ